MVLSEKTTSPLSLRIALTVDPELPVPPPYYGGIERIVDMLALGLSRRGHEVTLFAAHDSTCPVARVDWPGRTSRGFVDTLKNGATLAARVLGGKYDLVHSFARIAYMTPFLPVPVPKLMSYQREISPRSTRQATRLSRGTLEFSAISRQMIDAAPLSGRFHLVPNGVPLGKYTFRAVVADDAPFVFLGRVEEIKGPHLAIKIARQSGRRLVIAGNVPPEHRAWFEREIAPHIDGEQVRYVGQVDDRQKDELLGAAAALLMPILWEEPFGIVMTEAMACGTPVLAFRRGAVPEVVEDGVSGLVGDTVDDLIWAAGQVHQLDRASARSRVERRYSDDAITEAYLSIYEEMIARIRFRGRTTAGFSESNKAI